MTKVRSRLKKIGWLYELNARYKSAMQARTYAATVSRYRRKPLALPTDPALVQRGLALGRILAARKPRVFFLGTDYEQDHSGTLQALAKLSELTWFTRADGSYGQNDPCASHLRRRANADRLWSLVAGLARQGKAPDMLIGQTWRCLIDPEVFSRIRREFGTFIVNIAMDDRHQFWGDRVDGGWGGTYGLIPHIDLALTAAPECVDWYRKEGCAALYFPEASDPEIFHPIPGCPKRHDVSFVGARYGVRERLVLALRQAGVAVAAYGSGWGNGRLPVDDVPLLFAESKIILGVGTIGHSKDFYALKMRDFDAPMSGSFYLTHDNPDLYSLYRVGEEIEVYRSPEDCVAMVRRYLVDAERRERIAAAGRMRALHEHTWEQRFRMLFDTLRDRDLSGLGSA